jgi:hypothetical protein
MCALNSLLIRSNTSGFMVKARTTAAAQIQIEIKLLRSLAGAGSRIRRVGNLTFQGESHCSDRYQACAAVHLRADNVKHVEQHCRAPYTASGLLQCSAK